MLGLKENKTKEYYWAIAVESGLIQAGVWEINDNKAEVVSVGTPAIWETDAELIEAADTALSSAIQTLPEDFGEPSKSVFGVPPSWVEKGQIKEEYLLKIKNICTDLSLDPAGFVVLPEAIAHLTKIEEGSSLSAVILETGKDYLEISVFKLGNLLGNTTVARSISVFEDVIEGLSRFSTIEELPSRIIVYDGKEGELEEIKQLLITSEWTAVPKIKFLHTPKIEILSLEKKVLAVALAGASEIAGVVTVEKISEEHENLVEPETSVSAQEFGFIVDQDVAAKEPPAVKAELPVPPAVGKRADDILKGLGGRLKKIFIRKKEERSVNFSKKPGKKLITFGIIGIGLIISLLIFWWFYAKATVMVFVTPKQFEEKTMITVNAEVGETNLSEMIIPGEILSALVAGEKTKSTTGTKRVGDKASGSVKIQNGTDEIINLPAGTFLASVNNLKFLTTAAVSVSAALSPSNPGIQTVEISASDIGAEYNLAKDEIFKVGNYSKAEVDAASVADLTGGSSREISAVSAEDTNTLIDTLTEELMGNAAKTMLAELSADKVFIDDSIVATPSSKVFSGKVGDEAGNVKLSLELKANALAVYKKDLILITKKILEGSAPSGFNLNEDYLEFGFNRVNSNQFDLEMTANYLPQEDLTALAKKISGKKYSVAESKFASVPGFSRIQINFKPRFSQLFKIFPLNSKNITIEILSDR